MSVRNLLLTFMYRLASPRPGRSTFSTSHPRSPRSIAAYGPATPWVRSRTRNPSSAVMRAVRPFLVNTVSSIQDTNRSLRHAHREEPASHRQVAAVDGQLGPGDVGRGVAGQEGGGAGDVRDRPGMPGRD